MDSQATGLNKNVTWGWKAIGPPSYNKPTSTSRELMALLELNLNNKENSTVYLFTTNCSEGARKCV